MTSQARLSSRRRCLSAGGLTGFEDRVSFYPARYYYHHRHLIYPAQVPEAANAPMNLDESARYIGTSMWGIWGIGEKNDDQCCVRLLTKEQCSITAASFGRFAVWINAC